MPRIDRSWFFIIFRSSVNMRYWFPTLMLWLCTIRPVFAQGSGGGPNWGISWAIILLSVILGLLVTLKSSRRTSDVKKRKT